VLVIAAIIGAVFWRSLLLGEAFIPADQARYLAPWSSQSLAERRPSWNPLHYDSVGQFYSWSAFYARTLRMGRLPLWNPHQLCGTPFGANAQSALYYPPNVLRVLLGPARAAGWIAALHLIAAALLMFVFLRVLGLGNPAALIGGLTYAMATWQIAWLHLPTFAATSCWLPGILAALLRLRHTPGLGPMAALAALIALTLLAGHLQIALYVVLCSLLYGCRLAFDRCGSSIRALSFVSRAFIAAAIAVLIASPQVLPALELSRHSHRTGKPSAEGYTAYAAYAVHPAALATLLDPDLFGNPSLPERPYAGFSRGGMYFNYAEGALYVGLLPLMLATLGLGRSRTGATGGFATAIAVLALLLAMGTPAAMILYYGLPGFSQSGSPGRVLILWTLAVAWLAARGADRLLSEPPPARTIGLRLAGLITVLAVILPIAHRAAQGMVGESALQWSGLGTQAGLAILAALATALPLGSATARRYAPALLTAVVACDLLAHGVTYNATSRPDVELAQTPALALMARWAGHDRIAPINTNWSFLGPKAVIPPNLAMLFGMRDVQGYDSLLPGQYKRWLAASLRADPSPPEVGNMLFLRVPERQILDACGVRVVASLTPLSVEGASETMMDGLYLYHRRDGMPRAYVRTPTGKAVPVVWRADEADRVRLQVSTPNGGVLRLSDQNWPGWRCRVNDRDVPIARADGIFRAVDVPPGPVLVEFRFEPAVTRLGHYLLALGIGLLACTAGAAWAMSAAASGRSARS
jgi:hypothetical protein